MALSYQLGCDDLSTGVLTADSWTLALGPGAGGGAAGTIAIDSGSGQYGGGSLKITGTFDTANNTTLTKTISLGEFFLCFKFRMNSADATNLYSGQTFLSFSDGSTGGIDLMVTKPGVAGFVIHTTNNFVKTGDLSSGPGLSFDAWHDVCLHFKTGSGANTFFMYVDGVAALNNSANLHSDFGSAHDYTTMTSIVFKALRLNLSNTHEVHPIYFDDIILYTASGAEPNTVYSELRVDTLYPSAATAAADWTLGAGSTTYGAIKDTTGQDGDTTYIKDATSGHVSLFAYDDLSGTPGDVMNVRVTSYARSTDGAITTQYKNRIHSSASNGDGGTNTLSTSYARYVDDFATDPNGTITWTYTAVNALTAGVYRV